jgi:iron complex outermembrane recepter protein
MLNLKTWLCVGVSLAAMAASGSAIAQEVTAIEEVVVTAQRRSESVQEVPMTVTPVTAEQITDLKLQRFEDVQQLSPGLALNRTGRVSTSSLRGVTFNPDSGAAPSIDTYINEVPLDPQFAFQSIFDVQQIEVLRGPQGLNRGRPSPVGAITMTTRRPDMNEYGGSVNATWSEFDATNVQAAVSIPIVQDKVAVRLAALYDENDNGGVRNVIRGDESYRLSQGLRGTLEIRPTDDLDFVLSHTRLRAKAVNYSAQEGAGVGYNGPAIPDGRSLISVTEGPAFFPVEVDATTLNSTWDLGEHLLTYNFGLIKADVSSLADLDAGNAIPNYAGIQHVRNLGADKTITHELRLSSTGTDNFVDYTVGLWYFKRTQHTVVDPQLGAAFLPGAFGPTNAVPIGPPNPLYVLDIAVDLPSESENKAIYGNLAFHLTDKTDLEVGARYFNDKAYREATTTLNQTQIAIPNPLPAGLPCSFLPTSVGFTGVSTYPGTCNLIAIPAGSTTQIRETDENDWTYGASLRHRFTEDLMAYLTYGHSWRGGGMTVGVRGVPDDILFYDPEKSDSLEFGIKSDWFDGRLRVNAAIFRQKFKGYINTSGFRIPYVSVAGSVLTLNQGGGFTFNADAVTDGAEVEIQARPTENWDISVNWATADGHYDNAAIPCRDSNLDGVDDSLPITNEAALATALNSQGLTYAVCQSNGRINSQPGWSVSAQSEFRMPVGGSDMEAYLRGLLTYRPEVDFNNFVVDSYAQLNLFAGVRSDAWDFGVFARNVFDEDLQLSDPASPLGTYGGFPTGYRGVSYLRGRELGVSLRYSFGAG